MLELSWSGLLVWALKYGLSALTPTNLDGYEYGVVDEMLKTVLCNIIVKSMQKWGLHGVEPKLKYLWVLIPKCFKGIQSIPISARISFCFLSTSCKSIRISLPGILFTWLQLLTPSLSRAALQKTMLRVISLITCSRIHSPRIHKREPPTVN